MKTERSFRVVWWKQELINSVPSSRITTTLRDRQNGYGFPSKAADAYDSGTNTVPVVHAGWRGRDVELSINWSA